MRRSAWQRTITDANGVPISGVQITVFQSNGVTPATIFSTAAGAAQANPFTTATSTAKFFALPGVYVIQAFKDGQTQTFSDEEIGSKNYRDDQGALGGSAVIVDNMTADNTIMSEGGSFRFTSAATGKPAFMNNGQVWAAPHDGTPATYLIGTGLRPNSTRAAFIGLRSAVGSTPVWSELWDKTTSPAQSDLVDTTAGALLTVGSFGLGASTSIQSGLDCDTIGATRIQGVNAGVNAPTNAIATLAHYQYSADWRTQEYKVPNAIPQDYIRGRYLGTTWSLWFKKYHEGNVLGAVTFDGSKLTGGLLEYGSNANGQYYKYADGRLECILTRSSVAHTANTPLSFVWTFPAAFVSASAYNIDTSFGYPTIAALEVNRNYFNSGSATGATIVTQATQGLSCQVTHRAIGRWR